jgi:hypothetical protein
MFARTVARSVICDKRRQSLPTANVLERVYDERSTWLRLAHEQLDHAVLAAYAAIAPANGRNEGWPEVRTETGTWRLLAADHRRAVRSRPEHRRRKRRSSSAKEA